MSQTNLMSPFFTTWKKKIQYLSDYCSLQVLGYVLIPSHASLFKRIFWLVTILASCVCSVIVLRGALANYTSDAVSYSVETDYLEFDTPFPAITICDCWVESHKKIVEKYFNVTTVSESLVDFAKEVSFWSVKFCKQCLKCELGRTCIAEFSGLVKFIRKKCTELFVRCTWNDKPFPCCERFLPIETEYGTCFVFNSRLTGSDTLYTVNRKVGLHTLTFETMTKIMIRVHSSDEMLSVASDKVMSRCDILPLVSDLDLTLSAEQTVNDVSVQRLFPSSRDCLFDHEMPAFAHLWPFKTYSYGACLLYCRAITQIEACNCTHHFMPKIDPDRFRNAVMNEGTSTWLYSLNNKQSNYEKCGIEGLICFQEHKVIDRLAVDNCNCPMSCNEVMYKTVHVTCPRRNSKVSEDVSHSLSGTRGRIRLGHLPTLRVRRHAIRELLGLVVDVGGVIGVFFGASLLSFIEIFYLLCIRKYH